jgi:histidinol dehydrogenase
MRCERFTLNGDPGELAARLRALVPAPESVSEQVTEIIGRVRAEGDDALLGYTSTLDLDGKPAPPLIVEAEVLEAAHRNLDPPIGHALERAIENVRAVASAAHREMVTLDLRTHIVRLRREPVARAAVYVPGGRAPYPSTVVMGVIPAQLAGVSEISVCTPPGQDGEIPAVIAAACRMTGVTRLYRMGGAQAVAGLAYGTRSVDPVDVIVGPGNLWVQEAKCQVFGQVGIDGFAGPSDLVVIADGDADAELVSLDLLAQAEHGGATLVVALCPSERLLGDVGRRLERAPDTAAVAALVAVSDVKAALAVTEAFAPEHLELTGAEAEGLAAGVRRAGCLFVGPASGTAFGDYIAGSNHILPTAGAARFASGLSPEHFLRTMAEVRVAEPGELARAAVPLARAEGFELHARSMEARIRDNPPG